MMRLLGFCLIGLGLATAGLGEAPLQITTSSLPSGTVGTPYNQTLSASGGAGGYTWSTTVGSPPAGLGLAANGSISGTPTAAGTANFTVKVKDSSNATALQALTITIAAPPVTVTTATLPNGTVGVAYNQTLTASGGTGGYTWSTTAGSPPSGLGLAANGSITGTPTAAGTANFTVQVKDSSNATATGALSITVAAPLIVTTATLPNGTVGVAYSQTLSASGGTGGYTWSTTVGSPPAGLGLAANGSITGTPTAAGTANFTVQVKDSSNTTATKALSITVAVPPLTVTTATLPNGTVGVAYSQTLSASGGTGGYTWSTTVGSPPAGLGLAANGSISGTPTAAGTANFTVQVKDSSNTTATRALSITIAVPPLTVTTATLPNGTVGIAYSQTLSASGGTGGYAWSTTVGSPPAGLGLAANGSITGTPTAAGTANFTVQVKDSSNTTATQALSITIVVPPLTVTTATLPTGIVGVAYSQTLSASGGTGGYTWSTTVGSPPAGLGLAANGSITGTPTVVGTANFTVQVKDSSNATATLALSITITVPLLTVTTATLPNGTVGVAYSQTLSATGGTGGYTWSTTVGSPPAGLALAANGSITGTPTTAGTANFTVQVKDSSNTTATQALGITIGVPPLTVTAATLPNGTVGIAYSQTLSASGGTGGYTWSTTVGSPPAGLGLAANGTISGTPTAAGTANFTAQVKDSSNTTATQAFSISIAPTLVKIETAGLPGAYVGVAYAQPLSASGGSGIYSWSETAGSLPQGLSLSPNGMISGTPTVVGSSSFTLAVTDGNSSAVRGFTLTVGTVVTIRSTPLSGGIVGSSYSDVVNVTGGVPPYTWSVDNGQLPLGLSLDPHGGTISGTPTLPGTFTFGIQVTDSNSARAEAGFTVTINKALAITSPSLLATASAGAHYSQTFSAVGGAPPYSWSLSGTLPTGLSLSAAGVLAGTPTQVGTFPITVQVTDASSTTVSASYSVQVVSGLAIATPPVLPAATEGVPYTFTLQPAGGSPPYSWVVTAGSIPAGFNFTGGGQISGTATSTGNYTFTVQVTDGNSNNAQKQLTITVTGPLSISSTTLAAGVTGVAYSQTLNAAGGTPPYSWSVTAGSLPNGLTLEIPTGALAGTPTATGDFTFTVTVTDSNSVTAQKQYAISIGAGLTFTTPGSLPAATLGAAYNSQLQVSGGLPPYSWNLAQGSLPGGLSLNGASGLISGVPTAAGTFNFTVGVKDSAGIGATRGYTILVGLPGLPTVSITGFPGNLQALQQILVGVSLASPYPVPITGTVSLSFAPAGANPMDDPSVQFSTGGRSATFTIPGNATQATFGAPQFAVQAGSVTGSITLNIVQLQAAGTSLDIAPGSAQTATVAAGPPVVRSLSLVHTANGIQLQIVGLTDTRELTQANVTFQPAPGTTLQNSQVLVPLSDVAKGWFQDAGSATFGGQFGLTLPFTFQGNVSLTSVSVVLSNGSGDSQPVSANY